MLLQAMTTTHQVQNDVVQGTYCKLSCAFALPSQTREWLRTSADTAALHCSPVQYLNLQYTI